LPAIEETPGGDTPAPTILEATEHGTPPLKRYQRVVVMVAN
jgi:hypothetical protein